MRTKILVGIVALCGSTAAMAALPAQQDAPVEAPAPGDPMPAPEAPVDPTAPSTTDTAPSTGTTDTAPDTGTAGEAEDAPADPN